MVGVTTVALIERKPSISRDLFSRYWRDVHGVMAARIPGFATYAQYHVLPGEQARFEGVAIVTFASEADRNGLVTSDITQHIHRDEQNVFARALLYNLEEGASRPAETPDPVAPHMAFILLRAGQEAIAERFRDAAAFAIHDLRTGDPAAWNATEVDREAARYVLLVQAGWCSAEGMEAALAGIGDIDVLTVEARFLMVDGGRPTALGLRGLDAVRTIEEAGADNQLSEAVVQAIYGVPA